MFLPLEVMIRSFLRPVIAQEAVVVDRAEVAGVQPAVPSSDLVGRRRVAVVAREHVRARASGSRRRGRSPPRVPGSGRPTRAEAAAPRRVERRGGAGLGHAVALEHRHAAGVEELEHLAADRRGAGERQRAARRRTARAPWRARAGRRARGAARSDRPDAAAGALRAARRARRCASAQPKIARWSGAGSSTPSSDAARGPSRRAAARTGSVSARGLGEVVERAARRRRSRTRASRRRRARRSAVTRASDVRQRQEHEDRRRRAAQLRALARTSPPSPAVAWVSMQPFGGPVVPDV